jgi:hypothetical protein
MKVFFHLPQIVGSSGARLVIIADYPVVTFSRATSFVI